MCMVELVYTASSGRSRFHCSTILMSEEDFMLFFDGQCTFTIILILLTQTKAEMANFLNVYFAKMEDLFFFQFLFFD